MSGDTATRPQTPRQPRRAPLFAIGAVLVLVLLAIGYVQWRQYKLLDAASHFQNDALDWSFAQLETEQLRLRNELQLYIDDPATNPADKVQLRYDIFVSREGLVDQERAAGIMRDQTAYEPAIAKVRAFVAFADRYLGEKPAHPLDAAAGRELLTMVDALNAPLHDLSLGASHLLYQRATERNSAVRQQSVLSLALTLFQCLLLLALGVVVLRQLNALTDRRKNLEKLADTLSAARQGAESANRAKSAFLANMSHEIRTPFHGMLGMMSLLQEGGLSPQQATYLDTARDSAHHLLTILNDILDVSQLESGKLNVAPQTVDLPQLVTQVDALMRPQAHAKGLVLEVDVEPDVPRWVRADPTRLKQILFNLLSNAIKFTDRGTIILTVASGKTRNHVQFSIADSGIGMDDATLGRLFQRFMQGDESPSRRATGAGLGLEISRDLARLMGGDITARSRVGVGSTFVVSLPLAAVSAPTLISADEAPVPSHGFKRLRVLVAEDHPVNRAYLEAVLDRLGHVAVFSVDGDSAVRAVEQQPPGQEFDIVLMDLHMPGMDGFSAARKIRVMPSPRGRVPIVALTADAFQASRELARDAGMDGFLTKPAHLPQLREALERYGSGIVVPVRAPAATGPDGSLLDLATIADARDALTPARYSKMLGDFLQARATAVAELRRAATIGPDELRARAHSLKGAASSLGLRAVGEAADRLQMAARDRLDATSPEVTIPAFNVASFTAAAAARQDETGDLIARVEALFDASREECLGRGLLGAQPTTPGPLTPPEVRAPA